MNQNCKVLRFGCIKVQLVWVFPLCNLIIFCSPSDVRLTLADRLFVFVSVPIPTYDLPPVTFSRIPLQLVSI